MANHALANVDYLKLVKPRSDGSNDYELIGPRDVLETIFKDDLLWEEIKISFGTRSKRFIRNSDGECKLIDDFQLQSIVTLTGGGRYGYWTWSAWVKVLTSNGFTCKSVAHGSDGGIASEIWLFERKTEQLDVAMLEETK